jgi:hypothetical protein
MAGAGYRTWTAGEVVTASNVQSYLQDQTVGVYAGTAARSSAILSPSEGQVSYRTDDDIVEVYNGSAWTPVAPTNSGLIHIETQSFSAVASLSLNNIFSATYSQYKVIGNFNVSGTCNITLRYRVGGTDDSNANYNTQRIVGADTTVTASRPNAAGTSARIYGQNFASGENTFFNMEILNPFDSLRTNFFNQIGQFGQSIEIITGQFTNTTSFDGFTLILSGGFTMTGDISIYGYRK